jgi:hypothetical protein
MIPVTADNQSKNVQMLCQIDRERSHHLYQNIGENIFSANPNFIYDSVWGTKDKTSIFEINLFNKKLQYVQNLINESSRDIIIISTICIVILIT